MSSRCCLISGSVRNHLAEKSHSTGVLGYFGCLLFCYCSYQRHEQRPCVGLDFYFTYKFYIKKMLAMLGKEVLWLLSTLLPEIHWNYFPTSEVFCRGKLVSIPLNLVSLWKALPALNQELASRVPVRGQTMHLTWFSKGRFHFQCYGGCFGLWV